MAAEKGDKMLEQTIETISPLEGNAMAAAQKYHKQPAIIKVAAAVKRQMLIFEQAAVSGPGS